MAWPLADGHALVLLEFLGGGYGALVAAAWAMRKEAGLNVEGVWIVSRSCDCN